MRLSACGSDSSVYQGRPPAIIVPTDYMKSIWNQAQLRVLARFLDDLENTLDVGREEVSFERLWDRNPPWEARGETHDVYTEDVARFPKP